MPGRCCEPGCRNEKGGHEFPSDEKLKKKWQVAVRVIDKKTRKLSNPGRAVVCHEHFVPDDYSCLTGERKRLKKGIVPTVFSWRKLSQSAIQRRERIRLQSRKCLDLTLSVDCPLDVGNEVILETTAGETDLANEKENIIPSLSDTGTQCTLIGSDTCRQFTIENLVDKPDAVHYYTGMLNYEHVMFFMSILGPAAYDLRYHCTRLSPVDQLFLTLIKLRLAKDDKELGFMFSLSTSTVSQLFSTWINFLYYQLSEINTWISKEEIEYHMPTNFKKQFPATRVILDATEMPIQKPANVLQQSATFSTYKNRNTQKIMVGIAPHGLVTYVSDSYGGSTSDRQIMERSILCTSNSMFQKGDSIMADRGIMVQDLFASKDVSVNTPHMLKGKSQLSATDVVYDRRIASKRIHVERVIGLAKTFKILKRELQNTRLRLGNRITFVCFMLVNFRPPIVGRSA